MCRYDVEPIHDLENSVWILFHDCKLVYGYKYIKSHDIYIWCISLYRYKLSPRYIKTLENINCKNTTLSL